MRLHPLLRVLDRHPSFASLVEALRTPTAGPQLLSAITPARPYALAALHAALNRPMLLVVGRPSEARGYVNELRAWPSGQRQTKLKRRVLLNVSLSSTSAARLAGAKKGQPAVVWTLPARSTLKAERGDDYSLTADWGNEWLTGGLEADVIAEAHLDPNSIFAGVQRFAQDRAKRLTRQRAVLDALG